MMDKADHKWVKRYEGTYLEGGTYYSGVHIKNNIISEGTSMNILL